MIENQSQPTANMGDLAKHLCQMVVKQMDRVQVVQTGGDHTVIITTTVDDDDVGRVIGKQGATIKAIRYLLEQIGRRNKQKVYFELANKQANTGGSGPAGTAASGVTAEETTS